MAPKHSNAHIITLGLLAATSARSPSSVSTRSSLTSPSSLSLLTGSSRNDVINTSDLDNDNAFMNQASDSILNVVCEEISRGGSFESTKKEAVNNSYKEKKNKRQTKKKQKQENKINNGQVDNNSNNPDNCDQTEQFSKDNILKETIEENDDNSNGDNISKNTSSDTVHQSYSTKGTSAMIQTILNSSCAYTILDLTPSSSTTQSQIQKAYRKRCLLTHPDKTGGDRTAFQKVAKSYEILGSVSKRATYDHWRSIGGIQGNAMMNRMMNDHNHQDDGHDGGITSMSDIFQQFFSTRSHQPSSSQFPFSSSSFFGRHPFFSNDHSFSSSSHHQAPRNRDLRYDLQVSLEDLYLGSTKVITLSQQPTQRNRNLYQQQQQDPNNNKKQVEVNLTPGMRSGSTLTLYGVLDFIPHTPPANAIFHIREKSHEVFTRKGADLAMNVSLTLGEAIAGNWRRTIKLLDGSEITIAPPQSGEKMSRKNTMVEVSSDDAAPAATSGNINWNASESALPYSIQTGDVHVLPGKGMPKQSRSSDSHTVERKYGDLYIQYIVEMPGSKRKMQSSNLTNQERMELARLLHKLEGRDDFPVIIATSMMNSANELSNENINAEMLITEKEGQNIHYLKVASASDFGQNSHLDEEDNIDGHHYEEHLLHAEEDEKEDNGSHLPRGYHTAKDIHDLFQQAFAGKRTYGATPFMGSFGSSSRSDADGVFHYFSRGDGLEEDHKVECNQM